MKTKLLAPTLTLLLACGGPLEVEETTRVLTPCPDRPNEAYDFDALTRALDDDLVAQTQVDEVRSCEDAQRVTEALIARLETQAPFDGPLDVPDDDIATTARGIRNAEYNNMALGGVVRVGIPGGQYSCTGILINQRAILTAGHCFSHATNGADNAWLTVDIDSYEPARTDRYDGIARINIHPDYTGGADTEDDLAVVKLFSGSFPGFALSDRTRIYTGTFHNMNVAHQYGRGASELDGSGDNVLRRMGFAPDWFGHKHYYRTVRENGARVCNGDSGGPLIAWAPNGTRVVAGILSNSTKNSLSDVCARLDGRQRGVRLNQKVTFIEDMLDITCVPGNDGGWPYVRCF